MIGEKNCGKRLDSEVAAMLVLGTYLFHAYLYLLEGGKSSVPKFMGTKSKQAKISKEFPPAIKPPRFNNHRRATQNPRRCLLLLRPKCLAPLYKKVLGLLKTSKSFLKKRIRFSNKPFYLLEYSERQSILMEKTAKMPPYCFFGKS